MRMALAQAVHHTRHRIVFQKRLIDQPVMGAVLADMALVAEAATALVMRLARSFDLASTQAHEAARARLLTPAVKYWVCKIAPALIYEAMECLGGNGYVEESMLPRLYREAPVNAIWEGSGNVMCIDVLRALATEREASMTVIDEIGAETPDLPGGREAAHDLRTALGHGEAHARAAVGGLAVLAAAAALRASAPAVAELFARTRLNPKSELMFGASSLESAAARSVLDRVLTEDR
jgi:putative acyl-CoA dehydrogenase